jgi:hypothetical protein
MKKLFTFFIAVFFSIQAFSQAHIACDTNIVLEAGSDEQYASPDIYLTSTYDIWTEQWFVRLRLAPPGTTEIVKEFDIIITSIQFNDQFGTGPASDLYAAMEQAVVEEYLQPLNLSTTFTYE